MAEVKYDTGHHAGATPEARIANRLRNSGGDTNPDHCIQKGDGPTRTYTNIHHSAGQQHVKPSAGHTTRKENDKGMGDS
jgi:hypothetical protein